MWNKYKEILYMAEKRMFSKIIIDSDMFLDMPLSTQALYFHLCMRADDDGFLNNVQKIIRMINASRNDFELLLIKNLIIQFDDGVCVIKHWHINNYIRRDRYKATIYQEHAKSLSIDSNRSYSLVSEHEENGQISHKNSNYDGESVIDISDYSVINTGAPHVNRIDTQDKKRIEKDKLDKCSEGKEFEESGTKGISEVSHNVSIEEVSSIMKKWNSNNISRIVSIKGQRLKKLNQRVNEYGIKGIIEAISNIDKSSFLKGNNERNWKITFDWFISANNFTKVLEGNYTDSDYWGDLSRDKTKFNNFEARNYDFKELERKLLGWD